MQRLQKKMNNLRLCYPHSAEQLEEHKFKSLSTLAGYAIQLTAQDVDNELEGINVK